MTEYRLYPESSRKVGVSYPLTDLYSDRTETFDQNNLLNIYYEREAYLYVLAGRKRLFLINHVMQTLISDDFSLLPFRVRTYLTWHILFIGRGPCTALYLSAYIFVETK